MPDIAVQAMQNLMANPYRTAVVILSVVCCAGCQTMAPIHVWQPGLVDVPPQSQVALAPVAGRQDIARGIEAAMLAQRPAVKADMALITSEQLAEVFPVRLASTAALSNEVAAIHAARQTNATILLQGEVLNQELDDEAADATEKQPVNFNKMFFQKKEEDLKSESLLLSWKVIDVASGKTLGAHAFTVSTDQVVEEYPDLAFWQDPRAMLFAGCARETWQSIAPVVVKEDVSLAVPWLQPGAWRTRRGNSAAKKGDWQTAERHWQQAIKWFPFNAAAQHNLAIAQAAQEDFEQAKLQLQSAAGPLAIRLPGETLFWLDQRHRQYHQAHTLERPENGWAFPDSEDSLANYGAAVKVEELPWWSAIPFVKPPGWTWQAWLSQPWIL